VGGRWGAVGAQVPEGCHWAKPSAACQIRCRPAALGLRPVAPLFALGQVAPISPSRHGRSDCRGRWHQARRCCRLSGGAAGGRRFGGFLCERHHCAGEEWEGAEMRKPRVMAPKGAGIQATRRVVASVFGSLDQTYGRSRSTSDGRGSVISRLWSSNQSTHSLNSNAARLSDFQSALR